MLSNYRRKQFSTIRISLLPVTDELREMSISRDNDVATFEFTEFGLSNFREAIVAWRDVATLSPLINNCTQSMVAIAKKFPSVGSKRRSGKTLSVVEVGTDRVR